MTAISTILVLACAGFVVEGSLGAQSQILSYGEVAGLNGPTLGLCRAICLKQRVPMGRVEEPRYDFRWAEIANTSRLVVDMTAVKPPPVYVIGVGTTKLVRPNSKKWDYPDMAREAGTLALQDAGIRYSDIGAVVASYCYGEPTCGQRATYELGLTGVPVFNVNNNCSSGSSALMLARTMIQSGQYNCVLALGFEKMERGLSEKYHDRESPVAKHFERLVQLGAPKDEKLQGLNKTTAEVIRIYAYAAREYVRQHGNNCSNEDFATIAVKNRQHGRQNPNAVMYNAPPLTVEKALKDRMICEPITVHQASLTCDGGGAVIVCSQAFLDRLDYTRRRRAVRIIAQQMASDLPSSFKDVKMHGNPFMVLGGYDMAKIAADKCYKESGLTANDIDVLEVHDCFACHELFLYEALGLCPVGRGAELVRFGLWDTNASGGSVLRLAGGRWVVNPSGGLESKGHPIGATGLIQCHELVTQLRGEAQKRQVEGARVAMQHNFGIGGAAVVTMYEKCDHSDIHVANL